MSFLRKICYAFIAVVALSAASVTGSQAPDAFALFEQEKYEQAFPILLGLAKEGNPKAQGLVARMYGNGWAVEENHKEAYYWASRGAQKNDPTSQNAIGYIHWQGLAGFERNPSLAVEWMSKAANQNHLGAITNLAVFFQHQKNYLEAINWAMKAVELGDQSLISAISDLYEILAQSDAKYEALALEWAKRGAEKGEVDSLNQMGDVYKDGKYGVKVDFKQAINWYQKGAQKKSGYSYQRLGEVYIEKNAGLDPAAISYLNKAIELGVEDAMYVLAFERFFGRNQAFRDKENGYRLMKALQSSKQASAKAAYFELESSIYGEGVDRPRNIQKSILSALNGALLDYEDDGWTLKSLGVRSLHYVLSQDLFQAIKMPSDLLLAWVRVHYAESESAAYRSYKEKAIKEGVLTREIIEKSELIDLQSLVKQTLAYLENRRSEIGPIEAVDLVNEGWVQFVGKRGTVNEPLAQYLTEEGLRLALREGNTRIVNYARNNLGVILGAAANELIRNRRLAQVHIYDGKDTEFGPSNLLWGYYRGQYTLSGTDLVALNRRYTEDRGKEHLTQKLPPLSEQVKTSDAKIIEFLAGRYAAEKNPQIAAEIAGQIADIYEDTALDRRHYELAKKWYELSSKDNPSEKERLNRINHILAGQYVRDMPNFTGTIFQLFEVDLVSTRGGLLTNLTSGISTVSPKPVIAEKNARALRLHALVIGNSSYKKQPLANVRNDARAISQKFRQLGFQVVEHADLDRKRFREAIINFAERAQSSDVTVFYFAGHGMQMGGINYLLPTDVDFSMTQAVVTYDGISLNDLKNRNLPGTTRLIFLDACRNNPFEGSRTRGSVNEGLAPMNVGTGTLISFATKDGAVALDGVGGSHSPYTQALLKHLGDQEDVEIMLRAVGDEVKRLTKNRQEPWKYGALSGQKVILPRLSK